MSPRAQLGVSIVLRSNSVCSPMNHQLNATSVGRENWKLLESAS